VTDDRPDDGGDGPTSAGDGDLGKANGGDARESLGVLISDGQGIVAAPFLTGPGFGTVRFANAVGRRPPPATASARAYLRSGLPEIYQDEDFGMRLLSALEQLLDPIVGILDALPAHFSADLAPADILELLTRWLGIELDESQPTAERRQIVRSAAELGRQRGTRHGLELMLSLAFPGLPFRVEEVGRVIWGAEAEAAGEAAPSFVVYCDTPLPEARQAAVARLIEQIKPAHVPYKLRVKLRRSRREGSGDPEGRGAEGDVLPPD
jgi:phage tail-like protein